MEEGRKERHEEHHTLQNRWGAGEGRDGHKGNQFYCFWKRPDEKLNIGIVPILTTHLKSWVSKKYRVNDHVE